MPAPADFVDLDSLTVKVDYTPAPTSWQHVVVDPQSGATSKLAFSAHSAYHASVNGVLLGRLLRTGDKLWVSECVQPVTSALFAGARLIRPSSISRKMAAWRLLSAIAAEHPGLAAKAGL